MAGRLINGVKHIGLMNDNSFKSKSLEDNIYFTLRDIFWNGDSEQCMTANHFNSLLTNNICFEERDKNFNYSNVVYDYNSQFTQRLYNWLSLYKQKQISMFDFIELEEGDPEVNEIIMDKYMKYDDWWDKLQELIKKLEEQLEKRRLMSNEN